MSKYGVERGLLLACVMAATACTEPTFAAPDAEVEPSTSDDAEQAPGDGGARAEPHHTTDAGGSAPTDTGLDGAAIVGEAGAPSADAVATESDAAEAGPVAPPPDASVPDSIPSWAKPLLGRYAKRSMYFAYDTNGGVITVTNDVSLVTIAATNTNQLEWTSQQCSYRVHWTDGGASYTVTKTEALPVVHMWLSLGQAPHFSSDTGSLYMGFDPARQSRCSAGGSYAAKFEDQTWLSSRCTCSSVPEVLPVEASDCRVVDPDGDGRGGIALKGTGWAGDISAAINTTLKAVDGEVRADGEHVLREQRTRNSACLGGLCFNMNETLCPGGETLLRLLPADATCADAQAKVEPIPLPPFPATDCRPP